MRGRTYSKLCRESEGGMGGSRLAVTVMFSVVIPPSLGRT